MKIKVGDTAKVHLTSGRVLTKVVEDSQEITQRKNLKKICEKNDSPSLIRRILSYPNTEEGKGVWELVEKELKNFYKKS